MLTKAIQGKYGQIYESSIDEKCVKNGSKFSFSYDSF